jgi:hypothetical protein
MTMNSTQERPERTTLVLTSEINAWLDSQCAAMRAASGTCMSRSELLRAMVRATADLAAADFQDCRTEGDIGAVMFCGGIEDRAQG